MKEIETINSEELKKLAGSIYGDLIKGVIDIKNRTLVLDMEMHVDGEQYLLERGSKQTDLWGINLYSDKYGTKEFIEFDSMINIRPRQNNMSRNVEDAGLRKKITDLVKEKVNK